MPWQPHPHPRPRLRLLRAATPLVVALVIGLLAAGCAQPLGDTASGVGTATTDAAAPRPTDSPSTTQIPSSAATPRAGDVPDGDRLQVRVVGQRPHDASAFTQGLEFDEGRLFESRGLYSGDEQLTLTEIDPLDGSTIRGSSRTAEQGEYFAEGLTVVGDRIIQITWREGTAFVYDRDTFEPVGTFDYAGEGWGLCDQADRLVMSDGTSTLTLRDPQTFEVLTTVDVTLDGQPVERLNELECVGDRVWANVWQTDTIVVIDPDSGEVESRVDASGLLTEEERAQADVLNGIAYDASTGTWLLTGKLWPWMFEVEFECVDGCAQAAVPSHYMRLPARGERRA